MFREESLVRDREATVTQNIPIRVLTASSVEGIHEPRVRDPDVHLTLPPLVQLKAVSDRFTKLATATLTSTGASGISSTANIPKLELRANMHGSLKLSIETDTLNISSLWTGLNNPELEPSQIAGGAEGIEHHPSTVMKAAGPDAWATVRIDGRDWGRVLSVGRMGGRVIACVLSSCDLMTYADIVLGFVDEHALILYVYLSNYDSGADESVLTVIYHPDSILRGTDQAIVLYQFVYAIMTVGNSALSMAFGNIPKLLLALSTASIDFPHSYHVEKITSGCILLRIHCNSTDLPANIQRYTFYLTI